MHSIGEKPICQVCGKSFLPSAMAAHMATHNEARRRTYKCSTCGYAYYRKDAFQRHVQLGACANRIGAKSSIKYTCEVCGMSYKLKSSYNKHFKGTCAKRLEGGDKFFSADRLATACIQGDEEGIENTTCIQGDEEGAEDTSVAAFSLATTGDGDGQEDTQTNSVTDETLTSDVNQEIILILNEDGTCNAMPGSVDIQCNVDVQDINDVTAFVPGVLDDIHADDSDKK
jgi:rubredoxin